jgi:hypothetical protein
MNGQNRLRPQDSLLTFCAIAGAAVETAAGADITAGFASVPLAFSAVVAQSPESRTNGQKILLPQLACALDATAGSGAGAETGCAAGAALAGGGAAATTFPLSAAVGQSPTSRTNGQNMLLPQLAGALDAATGSGAGAETGCTAGDGFTGAGEVATILPLSAAVGQSPASRTNGQNMLLPQLAGALDAATGSGAGAETGCTAGAGFTGAGEVATILPLSAAVGQSPASRTNGQNMLLPQLADPLAAATGSGAGAETGCTAGAGFTGAGEVATILPLSAAVGQSPASRTNGQNMLLPQLACALDAATG